MMMNQYFRNVPLKSQKDEHFIKAFINSNWAHNQIYQRFSTVRTADLKTLFFSLFKIRFALI